VPYYIMPYSAEDKLAAIEREIAYRRRVYPRLITEGKLSQFQADRQIAIMVEISADYVAKTKGEDLFGG